MIGEFILQNLEKLCYVRYIPARFLVDLKHQFSRFFIREAYGVRTLYASNHEKATIK